MVNSKYYKKRHSKRTLQKLLKTWQKKTQKPNRPKKKKLLKSSSKLVRVATLTASNTSLIVSGFPCLGDMSWNELI